VCARLLARSRALYLEGQREEALTVPPVLLNTSLPPPVRPSFFQRFILVPGRVDKRIGKECLGWRKSAIRSGKLPVLSSSPPTSRQIFHSPHNRCRAVRPRRSIAASRRQFASKSTPRLGRSFLRAYISTRETKLAIMVGGIFKSAVFASVDPSDERVSRKGRIRGHGA